MENQNVRVGIAFKIATPDMPIKMTGADVGGMIAVLRRHIEDIDSRFKVGLFVEGDYLDDEALYILDDNGVAIHRDDRGNASREKHYLIWQIITAFLTGWTSAFYKKNTNYLYDIPSAQIH